MATMQKLAIVVKKIIELKKQGIAQSDIAVVLTNMNIKPPSAPTIRKYYNMDDAPSAAQLTSAFEKPMRRISISMSSPMSDPVRIFRSSVSP
jgi:hypothetical protein